MTIETMNGLIILGFIAAGIIFMIARKGFRKTWKSFFE